MCSYKQHQLHVVSRAAFKCCRKFANFQVTPLNFLSEVTYNLIVEHFVSCRNNPPKYTCYLQMHPRQAEQKTQLHVREC